MASRPPLDHPFPDGSFSILLVDGGDDWRLVSALMGPRGDLVRGSDRDTDVLVRLAIGQSGFDRAVAVGVVADCEADPAGRLASARAAIAQIPGAPSDLSHSEVRTVGGRRFGLFLVPDGDTPGSLETLLRRAWRPTARDRCVDDYFACVGPNGATVANRDKAWLKAWTAGATNPDLRPEQLIGKDIDVGHAAVDPLRRFLAALVGP